MDDQEIIARIGGLAEEEQRLEEQHVGEGLTEEEAARMKSLEVTLDQMWDLLRQRRALRSAGRSPDEASSGPRAPSRDTGSSGRPASRGPGSGPTHRPPGDRPTGGVSMTSPRGQRPGDGLRRHRGRRASRWCWPTGS